MPTQINGLPAHVLLIHLVIAAVPLAALFVVLHAVWPNARRRLGIVTPVVALAALVFVPVTTHAGEWLRDRIVPHASPELRDKIERHADLGGQLLPLVILLFVVAVAVWLLGRQYEFGLVRGRRDRRDTDGTSASADGAGRATLTAVRSRARSSVRTTLPIWASVVVAVVALAVAVLNVIWLYRIGDAGAQSVWGS